MSDARTTAEDTAAPIQEIRVLDHGYVALVNTMGADRTPAQTARTSFRNKKERTAEEDARLTRYLVKHRHCVTPNTRVLTKDLRWVPAGDLRVGDELIGFDENCGSYSSDRRNRSFRDCKVLSTGTKVDEVWELVLEDGSTVRCTPDHRWIGVTRLAGSEKTATKYGWLRTDSIGEMLATRRIYLPRVVKPWTTDSSYGAGLLAGAWDADGCFARRSTTSRLQFAQCNNELLKRVQHELTERGYRWSIRWSDRRSEHQTKPISAVSVLGGYQEAWRFLGSIRPPRIMEIWKEENLDGRKVTLDELLRVVTCRRVDDQEITLLGTSTETYIAEGLMAHNTTPLEFCQLLFYIKAPIFVSRQLVRYRMQSINEVSYRYVTAAREFYVPALDRMQKKAENNKQGSSEELIEDPYLAADRMRDAGEYAFDIYDDLLAQGLAPELARAVLPVSTYTEWYTQWDLHNFLHMIGQRTDAHAQYETRAYAEAMLALAEPHYPTVIAAWRESRK